MGKSSKAPTPPDPVATANAQSQYNRETAIAQMGLNSTNQITPYGNLTYEQIGSWEDGTPRFQATISLSPEQQALYNSSTALQSQLGTIGNNLAGRVSSTLSNPFKLGNEATEARLMELGRSRLDPMFAQRRESLDANLAARGITPGSEAYDREVTRFSQGQNDAYNQLLLTGRGQANNELLAERNQPLTELLSLLGGSQPTSPQFTQTPQAGVANVDYMGAVNQNYNAQMQQYQAQQQQNQGVMGGLFGLGKTLLGGWM